MGRNLDRRVELMVPIEDRRLRGRLLKILETFFRDNTQAWKILPDGTSERLTPAKGSKAFSAQEYFHRRARRTARARDHERAMRFEPHLPPESSS
jgi:polyphosphate kinase